jgi:TraX protein
VLGYNLGRPLDVVRKAHKRLGLRLALFGVIASIPFIALNKLAWNWWPLNIMFTLLVSVLVSWCLDMKTNRGFILAFVVFLIGGALVEFWWPAIAGCLFVRSYFRRPTFWPFYGFVMCVASLYFINGNLWALVALPAIALASKFVKWPVPRAKWFFYGFYPAHLGAIWCYLKFVA